MNFNIQPELPKDFDWKFYLEFYEDLRKAGLKTEKDAINHYLNHGFKELRLFKGIFKKFNNYEEIFKILCQKITPFLDKTFPKIDSKSNKKSLLVETRLLPHNEFIIKNTIQKLGDGWGHIIYCHQNNFNQIKSICDSISSEIEVRLIDDEYILWGKNINRNSYNNLLLNLKFWDNIDCEKVLIYQTDSFIFKQFDNSFLEWDYIGAIWGPSKHSEHIKKNHNLNIDVNLGNGGLSLRTVSAIKEILNTYSPSINNNYTGKKNDCKLMCEDIFFSYHMINSNKYKIAPLDIAKKFSWEHYYNEDSFGTHQPFVKSFENEDNFIKFINKIKGVNVFGLGHTDTGLGHNMRIIIEALHNSNIATNINLIYPQKSKKYLQEDKFNFFNTNLFLINPDVNYKLLLEEFKNKKNIALWAWEIEELPDSWKESSKYFDEIWTISDFCLNTFKNELPNKIIKKINIPGDLKEKRNKDECKLKFGFENKFVCLFTFDANSDIERKNPMAVIDTFTKSISKYENTLLVIKSHNLNDNQIKKYFSNLPKNVLLINKTLSKEELTDLFNCSDVYISLHRSEGSGLTIMEAINLEIPVICTNYSGNLDFCDENCQLVDYELINVKSTHPSYIICNNAKWANPSIDDASKKLIEVYENYSQYKEKIKISKERMNSIFNLKNLNHFLEKNLITIH